MAAAKRLEARQIRALRLGVVKQMLKKDRGNKLARALLLGLATDTIAEYVIEKLKVKAIQGDRQALSLLLTQAREGQEHHRKWVLFKMQDIAEKGMPQIIPTLELVAKKDPIPSHKYYALLGLGKLYTRGVKPALPVLENLLLQMLNNNKYDGIIWAGLTAVVRAAATGNKRALHFIASNKPDLLEQAKMFQT
jgi:hypothetical protein